MKFSTLVWNVEYIFWKFLVKVTKAPDWEIRPKEKSVENQGSLLNEVPEAPKKDFPSEK